MLIYCLIDFSRDCHSERASRYTDGSRVSNRSPAIDQDPGDSCDRGTSAEPLADNEAFVRLNDDLRQMDEVLGDIAIASE
jgi:hypothetical protein